MGETSVYKYYRPIMVMSYARGHFPVENATAVSAKDLTFKKMSISFIVSIIGTTVVYCLCDATLIVQNQGYAWFELDIVWTTMLYFVTTWLICKTMNSIKAFIVVDKHRSSLTLLPDLLKPLASNPTMFSKAITVFYLLTILQSIVFGLMNSPSGVYLKLVSALYVVCLRDTIFGQCLVFCCVFYSCSMVVEDFQTAWDHYCRVNCRPFNQLHGFSQSLMFQTESLRELDEILRRYFVVFFVQGICDILHGMQYFIAYDMPVVSMIANVVIWNVFLGVLIISTQLSKIHYDNYTREVFDVAVRNMPSRDHIRVRVLLSQLENSPGEFTAEGFFKVDPDLMLSFFSFGISYIIFYAQNLSEFKNIFGISESPLVVSSNSTV